MNVYVFGNPDSSMDNRPFLIEKKLKGTAKNIKFIEVFPNSDLPFENKENVVILDTIQGIKKVEVLTTEDLNNLITDRNTSVHDFDLGFQLKYLKKLGKLGNITIIGVPQKGRVAYSRIQSILRKLVAQDIQGS